MGTVAWMCPVLVAVLFTNCDFSMIGFCDRLVLCAIEAPFSTYALERGCYFVEDKPNFELFSLYGIILSEIMRRLLIT